MRAVLARAPSEEAENQDRKLARLRQQLSVEAIGLKRATVLARSRLIEEMLRAPGAPKKNDEIR